MGQSSGLHPGHQFLPVRTRHAARSPRPSTMPGSASHGHIHFCEDRKSRARATASPMGLVRPSGHPPRFEWKLSRCDLPSESLVLDDAVGKDETGQRHVPGDPLERLPFDRTPPALVQPTLPSVVACRRRGRRFVLPLGWRLPGWCSMPGARLMNSPRWRRTTLPALWQMELAEQEKRSSPAR